MSDPLPWPADLHPGWRGRGTGGAEGCQLWRLEPRGAGCVVHTEEVQRGVAPRLLAPVIRPVAEASHQRCISGASAVHQRWLTGLAALATLAPHA